MAERHKRLGIPALFSRQVLPPIALIGGEGIVLTAKLGAIRVDAEYRKDLI